ncbi:MAG: hypothetical protein IKB64_10095 [Paludibacteraceae bacterium]|nr:hypothetical protein [Paludibacteraceae bacterium]
MAASKHTKSCRRKLWFFRILDWICLLAPLLVYLIIALANGGIAVTAKVAVMSTTMIAILLTGFNVLAQKRLRCPIWIILIGLYVAMRDYLMPLIIILAVTSVLDDLVFTPLISYYHTKLIANKAMDERLLE